MRTSFQTLQRELRDKTKILNRTTLATVYRRESAKATRPDKSLQVKSGETFNSSAGAFSRLTQTVGKSNHFAPEASHPANAANAMASRFRPSASSAIW